MTIKKNRSFANEKKHWVRLTYGCNQKCLFCLDGDVEGNHIRPYREVITDLKRGILTKASRAILSGGEATISPDFVKIIKEAKKMGYRHIQVITNGRMFFYRDYLALAVSAGLNEITFSVHGHTSLLHDKLVGVPGAFFQTSEGVKNALSVPGLIVSMDICANSLNYMYLKDIMKKFIAMGVYEFDLLYIIPFGRAWQNKKIMFPPEKKFVIAIQDALALSKDKRLHIWTNRLPPRYLEGFEKFIQDPVKIEDEVDGSRREFIMFLQGGTFLRCEGERCKHCFLRDFCRSIYELRKNGKIISKKEPLCLKQSLKKQEIFHLTGEHEKDLDNFIDFYIRKLYTVKSLRCAGCRYHSKCDGAPIAIIKKRGFHILKPIKKCQTLDIYK